MGLFHFVLDLGGIQNLNSSKLEAAAKEAMSKAGAALTLQTHAHIVELASKELHTSKRKFLDELSFDQINENTWVITLGYKARWIDDGMPQHEMIEDLLKSPKAKTSKSGSRYLSVPFEHKGGKSQIPAASYDLTQTVRSYLRHQGIPYGSIEKDAAGKPKLGLLHKFDIMGAPLKTHEGPGQGHGPIGQVKQGLTGIPFLQNVRIYQRLVKDKTGKEHVQRSIMTFRTVSSKQKGSGKWIHPGMEGKNFLDRGVEWAQKEWDEKIAHQILDEVLRSL